jgi:electron transfer flavoprotein beta subunit
LNIVVCVKQTPDTAATISIDGGQVSWGDAPLVLNPWDEYAVEQALLTKEEHGGKVSAITLGPEDEKEALKLALAMGCDEETELVFFGRSAVDTDSGVLGFQVARRLGWPSLSYVAAVSEIDPTGKSILVERMIEEGRQIVSSDLPAVVSVVKEINEPRYPSFMGIRKASRAEMPVWSAEDLGISEPISPAITWPELVVPPVIDTVCEFIEGETPAEVANKLADRLVEEKVI